ncbi:hypothetical protein Pyrfu_0978 [Pyrolobus fumarii 1A]|uniref:Uncharacterized protein n=1 Tax=Pyrolobus fumarii (strain DSM 11204 / 1A) TaxID=694429 RepID=G0EEM4_PYRF1|nr:hypothetical protein [Pyrolobus fumarii]AEM38846.1 hypothetical protein Pyrfu_0978 [Pyrolobus fumarii 1A]
MYDKRDVIIVVVNSRGANSASIVSSGNPLDVRVACRPLREHLKEAAGQVASNIVFVDDLVEARKAIHDAEQAGIVLLVDGLSGFTNPKRAFEDALESYIAATSDVVVLATKPYAERGVRVATRGSTLVEAGVGSEAFAGVVAGKREKLLDALNRARSWIEVLNALHEANVVYWSEPWIRLETPYDILLYNMLVLQELREARIAANAEISPTAVIEGPVVIEERARIDHYAVIKGPAMICKDAFVGLHATVRQYSVLEENARVDAYSEVYVTSLQRGATLSSHTYLTGSIVGEAAKVEPFVVTKVLYEREAAEKLGIIAPFTPETRAGAVIYAGARVPAGTVLEPLAHIKP